MTQSVVVQGKGVMAPGPPAAPSPCLSRVSPLCSGTVREPGGMPFLGPGAAGTRRRQQGKGAAAPQARASRPRCRPRPSLWLQGAVFVCLDQGLFTVSTTTLGFLCRLTNHENKT